MLVFWLTLACGAGPPTEVVPLRSIQATEPWSRWDLPVAGGRVVYSDTTVLSVRYDDTDPVEIARTWRTAIRAAGGIEQLDLSEGPLVSVGYGLEEHRLALTVAPLGPATTVVMTLDGAAIP